MSSVPTLRINMNVPVDVKQTFIELATKEGLTQTELFIKLVLERSVKNENYRRI